MLREEVNAARSAIESTIDSPEFFSAVFTYIAKKRKAAEKLEGDNFVRIFSEEYDGLSRRIDLGGIQESCSVRNNLRTRRLANLLIDDRGMVNIASLKHVIKICKEHLYFLGPDRQYDSLRQEHILFFLQKLYDDKEFLKTLQAITRPHFHPVSDEIIRDTLQLSPKITITDAHTRRAVLSAGMCYLRQALGSCFATAPAIVIHDEQPLRFFEDMNELFGTGRLKRTFSGIEYSVPLNGSSGTGDLKKPFLISSNPEETGFKLSEQPGLILALEKEGLIEESLSLHEKQEKLREYIKKFVETSPSTTSPYLIVNIEQILRFVFLDRFSVTEEQVKEMEKRAPRSMPTEIMMRMPGTALAGGKGDSIYKFKEALNRAKKTFKSFGDNALLRSWEYTMASFAETKGEFSRWNLYSSLGLRADDQGGIGFSLYTILKNQLEAANRDIEEYQFQYEQMFAQVKIVENRLKRASSEDEARWLKIDYKAKVGELDAIVEYRDRAHFRAKRIANLFDQLIGYYIDLFPKYFQEVYDPEMMDINVGPYNDSPAGFRLLYKHGRTNSAQWSIITNQEEFIDALSGFFIAAERNMDIDEEFKGLETLLSEITTEIVGHIKTKEFLETALYRMAAAHNTGIPENPLENMDKVEKKPWVYTSGGNLHTLVSVYFRREHKPTSVSRWVENPQELLVFLADTLKKIPYQITKDFEGNTKKSMLMYSPTHAFILKPGQYPFVNSWKNEEFTYTWIRDHLIFPMQRFNDAIVLNSDAMLYLVNRLMPHIPENFRPLFKQTFGDLRGSMSVPLFRDYLIKGIETHRGLSERGRPVIDEETIDKTLYSHLPIFPIYSIRDHVGEVLSKLPGISKKEIENALLYLEEFTPRFLGESVMGAKQFQDVCKALICLIKNKTSFSVDYHTLIKRVCEELGYSMPRPIIVADTNWVKDYFSFVVNPGTGKLEFWCTDALGVEGTPMSSWNKWLDGSVKKPDWGIFVQPYEYTG